MLIHQIYHCKLIFYHLWCVSFVLSCVKYAAVCQWYGGRRTDRWTNGLAGRQRGLSNKLLGCAPLMICRKWCWMTIFLEIYFYIKNKIRKMSAYSATVWIYIWYHDYKLRLSLITHKIFIITQSEITIKSQKTWFLS